MKKFKYFIFYKPFGVLSQFTGEENQRTLAEFNLPKEIYAAGRLDKDSEGLLLLTNDGPLIHRLLDPKFNKEKTYWVQVEGIPTKEALAQLKKGVTIKGYQTLPCQVQLIEGPSLPERVPPIRERQSIPTSWIEIKLREGKNRQVRRMTAKVGFPTLRLVRVGMGALKLNDLAPGEYQEVKREMILSLRP